MNNVAGYAGWVFGIVSSILTAYGWKMQYTNAEKIAKKKAVHDAIDAATKSLTALEDAAYSFWTESDSKIKAEMLVVLNQRVLFNLKQIKKLKDQQASQKSEEFTLPQKDISELRKNTTLDIESRKKGTLANGYDIRLRKISRAISLILESDLLEK